MPARATGGTCPGETRAHARDRMSSRVAGDAGTATAAACAWQATGGFDPRERMRGHVRANQPLGPHEIRVLDQPRAIGVERIKELGHVAFRCAGHLKQRQSQQELAGVDASRAVHVQLLEQGDGQAGLLHERAAQPGRHRVLGRALDRLPLPLGPLLLRLDGGADLGDGQLVWLLCKQLVHMHLRAELGWDAQPVHLGLHRGLQRQHLAVHRVLDWNLPVTHCGPPLRRQGSRDLVPAARAAAARPAQMRGGRARGVRAAPTAPCPPARPMTSFPRSFERARRSQVCQACRCRRRRLRESCRVDCPRIAAWCDVHGARHQTLGPPPAAPPPTPPAGAAARAPAHTHRPPRSFAARRLAATLRTPVPVVRSRDGWAGSARRRVVCRWAGRCP
eukprot:scaffold4406_cov112-Isochrysis_galbana.AAC.21